MGDPEEDEGQEGAALVSMLGSGFRERLHITVGTRDAFVPRLKQARWWNRSRMARRAWRASV